MWITTPNSELTDKLLLIALGDLDLVQEAIRAGQESPDKPADLEKIVDYIVEHRGRLRQKVA